MASQSKPAVTAGIILGIAYLIAALIENPWWIPFVLPFLSGALAVYLSSRRSNVSAASGAKLGAIAGSIGGLMLVVIGAPLVYLVVSSLVDFEKKMRQSGLDIGVGGFAFMLIYLLIYAAIGVALASIAGLVSALIFGKSRIEGSLR